MIVEILPAAGLGRGEVLRIPASQMIVRNDDGTPISLAAVYGPDNSIAVSKVGDDDFQTMLRNLGVMMTVNVQRLELPKPPPGARLVAGPRPPK